MSDATITHSGGTISPTALSEYLARRPSRTVVHTIIGREDADYTFRPAGLREGSFSLVFPRGSAEVAEAVDAFATPQVLTLASVSRPEVAMSFVIADGAAPELRDGTGGESILTVPYREVAP
jgi:hypothetical protein